MNLIALRQMVAETVLEANPSLRLAPENGDVADALIDDLVGRIARLYEESV